MAVIKCISAKSKVGHVLKYVQDKEKTEEKIISGINCNPETAKEEMNFTKELHGKTEGRQYYHVIQSFKPGEVTPGKAHEIGKELAAKKFKDYECVVVTHTDREHVHNHIVVNSVNKETGKMYHSSKQDLKDLKNENDSICNREGLSVPEKKKNRYFSMGEVKIAEKGDSLKFRLMDDIDHAKEKSLSRDEFIEHMKEWGYEVNWTDTRKYITYTTTEGKKFRDKSLPSDYSKEVMENGFRQAQEEQRTDKQEGGNRKRGKGIDRNFEEFFGDEGGYDRDQSQSNDRNGKLYDGQKRDAGLEGGSGERQKNVARGNKELRRNSKERKRKQYELDKQNDRGYEGRTESTKEGIDGDWGELQEVTKGNQGRVGKDQGTGKTRHEEGIETHFEDRNREHIRNGDLDNRVDLMGESMVNSKVQGEINLEKEIQNLNGEIVESVKKDLMEIKKGKEEIKQTTKERSFKKDISRGRGIER